ncbi:MAG: YgaP-like transmembrane domain [Candidatus Acidiferrales bacterium]
MIAICGILLTFVVGGLDTALLACSFGLGHAADEDPIAAIDNVTRSLMQDGKRPVTVALMFSLRHSTIVVPEPAAIAGAARALRNRLEQSKKPIRPDSAKQVAIARAFVLASLALGYWVSPYWFLFTAFVGLIVFQSAFTNWCPMMTFLRKLSVKS